MPDSGPVVAHAIGCPAGIAPELTARMLADGEVTAAARMIVIGDARVLAKGAATAGVALDIATIADGAAIPGGTKPVLIDMKSLDPATIPVGALAKPSGDFAMGNFRKALALCRDGVADAVTFSPFNKASMRLSHPAYEDEVVFLTEFLHFEGVAQEFNILPGLWNARVTSHVPISGVAALITRDAVLRGLKLTHDAMKAAGFTAPRIAVAGLNPHAGDGGNFGREDIDEIEPAVKAGQAAGVTCAGPFPVRHRFCQGQERRVRRGADDVS